MNSGKAATNTMHICIPSVPFRGELVIKLVAHLESAGLPTVYLRNHENLPYEVGNDVDLLVPAGKRRICEVCLIQAATSLGWSHLKTAEFGPLAVYLANPQTGETLHLDLFDRIDWHALEFADSRKLFERRVWNGQVHIPSPSDEVFLNLMTRLIYHGQVRPKHREQAAAFLAKHGLADLRSAFATHLGRPGVRLALFLASHHWEATRKAHMMARLAAILHHGLRRPHRLLNGLLRYGSRIVKKLLHPPGAFLVFEGADGVGKSTLLEQITPWCAEWNANRAPYRFHWKPGCRVAADAGPSAPADPRSNPPRSQLLSVAFIVYHILGFWWGWLTRVYPAVVSSRVVIGDRYAYDLFLDPRRFRLSLSPLICRRAVALCPRPDLGVGLVADPQTIHLRKPELDPREIAAYQDQWRSLSRDSRLLLTVDAEGEPGAVLQAVKQEILTALTS